MNSLLSICETFKYIEHFCRWHFIGTRWFHGFSFGFASLLFWRWWFFLRFQKVIGLSEAINASLACPSSCCRWRFYHFQFDFFLFIFLSLIFLSIRLNGESRNIGDNFNWNNIQFACQLKHFFSVFLWLHWTIQFRAASVSEK